MLRLLAFLFRVAFSFAAVLGLGMIGMLVFITGGPDRRDLTVLRRELGQAYVQGLKDVEITARRLRGDYCAGQIPADDVEPVGRPGPRHFLGYDGLLHRPRILATVLTWPAHAYEPGVVQRPLPRLLLRERLERPGRMPGKPAPDALPKGFVLR